MFQNPLLSTQLNTENTETTEIDSIVSDISYHSNNNSDFSNFSNLNNFSDPENFKSHNPKNNKEEKESESHKNTISHDNIKELKYRVSENNFIRDNNEKCKIVFTDKEIVDLADFNNLEHGDIINSNKEKSNKKYLITYVLYKVNNEIKLHCLSRVFNNVICMPEIIVKHIECPKNFYKNLTVMFQVDERLQKKYNTKNKWINS
jgi:hypothetical protein